MSKSTRVSNTKRASEHAPGSIEPTHVIFDLASLRFRIEGGVVVVFSPTGEQLGSAVVPSPDAEREGCLAALDDALRTRLWRLGHRVKVGYYNPHTAEISLTPSERGAAFSASRPIPIDSGGLLAALNAGSEPERLVLADGTVAIRQSPTYRDITRRLVEIRDRHGVDPTIRPSSAGFR